ncbi:hypothetical protein C8R43DRAFT_833873, partial [Mycena crocata]
PAWFQQAHEVIRDAKLGPDFCALVGLLIKVEAGYNYRTMQNGLTPLGRPKEVSSWMGSGRGRRGGVGALGPVFPTPTSKSPAAFGKTFNEWWRSLQPKWRTGGPDGQLSKDAQLRDHSQSKEWAALRSPGANGVFIVVLILFWWGRDIPGPDSSQRGDWSNAVEDAAFM